MIQALTDYYVYVYYDPRSNTPIYVGKGRNRRKYAHLLHGASNTLLNRKISELQLIGLLPTIVEAFDNLTEQSAFLCETMLINKYGRIVTNTGTLCNFTTGGEGVSGHKQSEEHRRKNSLSNSRSYEEKYGTKIANELKAVRALKLKGNTYGKNITIAGRNKISQTHKGKKQTADSIRKRSKIFLVTIECHTVEVQGHSGLQKYGLSIGLRKHTLSDMVWKKQYIKNNIKISIGLK